MLGFIPSLIPTPPLRLLHSEKKWSPSVTTKTWPGSPRRDWKVPRWVYDVPLGELDQQICSAFGRSKEKRASVTSFLTFSPQPSQHHVCSRVIFYLNNIFVSWFFKGRHRCALLGCTDFFPISHVPEATFFCCISLLHVATTLIWPQNPPQRRKTPNRKINPKMFLFHSPWI